MIDFVELDMPTRTLDTMAVMCTITPEALQDSGIEALRMPGSLHAAEHAAIGLLPLVASCDRGDIGGVSTAVGPVDGLPTIFVYDGYPGGAGFADRGFRAARDVVGRDGRRRSRRASARTAVRRACSRRNAETATTRWTKWARCACCDLVLARTGAARGS